jgi:hypothetical protein
MGCSFAGSHHLKTKEDCEITFEWEGNCFRSQASVVWKSSQGETGLKFLDMDVASEQLLRRVCAQLRLQPLAPLRDDFA